MLKVNNEHTIDINSFNNILKSDDFKIKLTDEIKNLIKEDLIYYKKLIIQEFNSDIKIENLFKYIELVYDFKTNELKLFDLMTMPNDHSLQIKDRANCLMLPIYARSLRDNLLKKFVFNSKLNKMTSLDQLVNKFLEKIKNKFKSELNKFNLDLINDKNIHLTNGTSALENIKIPYWSSKPDNQYTFFPTNIFDLNSLNEIKQNIFDMLILDESFVDYQKLIQSLLTNEESFISKIDVANTNPDWSGCYCHWNQILNNNELARAFTATDFDKFFHFVRKNYGDDEAGRILNEMYNSDNFNLNFKAPLTNQAIVITNNNDFDEITKSLLSKSVKVLLINTQATETLLEFKDNDIEINPALNEIFTNVSFPVFKNELKQFENNPNVTLLSQNQFKNEYQHLYDYDAIINCLNKKQNYQSCFYVF